MTKARDLSKLLSTANGKIAGTNLDVSFENISDTGTTGTKVASGTTGQRGSTTGQIRFNTTTGLAEYYTGTEFKVIDTPPAVTAVSPLLVSLDAGGNETFTITGTNFQSGAITKFIGSDGTEITASTTTVNSSTSITAVISRSSFVNAKEPYDVKVINSSGLSGILDNQINVDTSVVWSTASGSLGTLAYNASGNHYTVVATDADSDVITYSVLSGSLPTGLTLNSSTGVISGTLNNTGGVSVSSFTLRASTTYANADRSFSITVGAAPYSIDFLVVAGGGGGAASDGNNGGGGGGAGGYRTSTQSVNSGTVITVIVGDGGNAQDNYGNSGTVASNSSISGSGITTITSAGGGWGARSHGSDQWTTSGSGGSGGGGGGYSQGGTGASGNTPSTSPSQGNNGGNGTNTASYPRCAGGGGGAGSAGSDFSGSNGGNGGNGTASSITGSSIYYAGGGGGGTSENGGGSGGNGGLGGGGQGAKTSGATSGTVNTGGGGGGTSNGNAGSGGKGVVILRMPTASYSGTTTGSPTVTTDGSYKVLQFNGSGSYTA